MPTFPRPAVLAFLAALAACSPSERHPASCRSDDECPAASRCTKDVCVADAQPVAAIRPLTAVETFALVQLDGSGSRDPDRADGVTEHAWTVRSLTARCEPPYVAGVGPVAPIRFGCPGRYEVSLTVRDVLGVQSEPDVVQVDVVAPTGAPVVTAGPDVSIDHLCSGDPLVCRPTGAVALSASAALAGVALHWSVEPPADLPLQDGTRRVRFVPGPYVASPTVEIETDGTAISGDWVFRVEARDAYGVLGAAYSRVSIQNRRPIVVTGDAAAFPHAFDPARSVFVSSGEIAWAAIDPDGDPLDLVATWRHVGDGGAPFGGELEQDRVTFRVEVPYAVPQDALFLRGGPDLSRRIELVARDVNRGEGRATVPVEIGNRPPEPAGGTAEVRVPHTFDGARSRYVANVRLGAWVDPDGDPLSGGPGIAPCDDVFVVDGIAHAQCAVPFEGLPALDRLAGHRSVAARVRDPWDFAVAIPVYAVEILNSPPSLATSLQPATVCGTLIVDPWNPSYPATMRLSAIEFTASPSATDPDGDPLLLVPLPAARGSATPEQAVCTTRECLPFRFVQPMQFIPWPGGSVPNRLEASDGAAQVVIDASPTPWPSGC